MKTGLTKMSLTIMATRAGFAALKRCLPDVHQLPCAGGRFPSKAVAGGLAVLLVAAFAFYQLLGAGLMWGRAWLAPILIERAWEHDRALNWQVTAPKKPWSWADTYPAMKLRFMINGTPTEPLFVLAEPTMRALAFGPVILAHEGATILFAHRETHFKGIGRLQAGDKITATLRGGQTRSWTVRTHWIMSEDAMFLPDKTGGHARHDLLLVTCYPLDGFTPTDQRYVVWATMDAVG